MGETMASWEYYTSRDDSELETLGRQGWELVSVLPGEAGGAPTFYFKRPAHDFREEVTLDQKRRYYSQMDIHTSTHDSGQQP
jgi:hypothetical protein